MIYEKPEIIALCDAHQAICGVQQKEANHVDANCNLEGTPAAYEADE